MPSGNMTTLCELEFCGGFVFCNMWGVHMKYFMIILRPIWKCRRLLSCPCRVSGNVYACCRQGSVKCSVKCLTCFMTDKWVATVCVFHRPACKQVGEKSSQNTIFMHFSWHYMLKIGQSVINRTINLVDSFMRKLFQYICHKVPNKSS